VTFVLQLLSDNNCADNQLGSRPNIWQSCPVYGKMPWIVTNNAASGLPPDAIAPLMEILAEFRVASKSARNSREKV
jgi:hypothetical protein